MEPDQIRQMRPASLCIARLRARVFVADLGVGEFALALFATIAFRSAATHHRTLTMMRSSMANTAVRVATVASGIIGRAPPIFLHVLDLMSRCRESSWCSLFGSAPESLTDFS
jgi:hypothetical protein